MTITEQYSKIKKEYDAICKEYYEIETKYKAEQVTRFLTEGIKKYTWTWYDDEIVMGHYMDEPFLDSIYPHDYIKVNDKITLVMDDGRVSLKGAADDIIVFAYENQLRIDITKINKCLVEFDKEIQELTRKKAEILKIKGMVAEDG